MVEPLDIIFCGLLLMGGDKQVVRRDIEELRKKWNDYLSRDLPVPDENDDDEIWDLFHNLDEAGADASILVGRVLEGKKHMFSKSGGRYLERKIQSLLKRKQECFEIITAYKQCYDELKDILVLVDAVGRRTLRS